MKVDGSDNKRENDEKKNEKREKKQQESVSVANIYSVPEELS